MLRSYGAEGIRYHIREHIGLTQELLVKLERDPRFEIVAPTPFALISFRHRGGEAATVALGEAINASGHSYVTPSQLEGVTFIRVSIGQTHTVKTHVERLWRLVDAAAAPLT